MQLGPKFEVSVIIPVYNAEEYIITAVESALEQPETQEVVLIEDGSLDNSLSVCKELVEKHEDVKLLQHPDRRNHGAAASRNLGIEAAICPYVAFLDADDYFLPKRFVDTALVFASYEDVDGVYEAVGATFEDEVSRSLFESAGLREITTLKRKLLPEELFESFLKGGTGGYYSIIGFTARKQVFSDVAYFDENLEMYEDTKLMFQLSAKCKLYPGNIETPIAIRRVHPSNRITHRFADKEKTYITLLDLWKSILVWAKNDLTKNQIHWVYERIILHLRNADFPGYSAWKLFLYSRIEMIRFGLENVEILSKYYFWRYLL